jgi:hypothetical protein
MVMRVVMLGGALDRDGGERVRRCVLRRRGVTPRKLQEGALC